MSRNGSGVYTPPGSSFPAIDDTVIESTDYNTVINDLASALTQSLSVDGQSVVTGNIPMANHKFTGLAAGTTAGDSVRFEQLAANLASPAITGNATFAGATTFNHRVDFEVGATIASATTVDLSTATGNTVIITGTTTTTGFTMNAGQSFLLLAAAAWPLTYHATNLNINGGANYTCSVHDRLYIHKAISNIVYVDIIRANGLPLSTSGLAPLASPALTGSPTAPTAADGDSSTAIATTEFVSDGWFESAEQVITNSSTISVNHGLGRVPKAFSAVLRCKVSQYGYDVGDEVSFDNDSSLSPTYTTNAGLYVTSTTINFRVIALNVMRLDSTSLSSITNSSWRLVFRCR